MWKIPITKKFPKNSHQTKSSVCFPRTTHDKKMCWQGYARIKMIINSLLGLILRLTCHFTVRRLQIGTFWIKKTVLLSICKRDLGFTHQIFYIFLDFYLPTRIKIEKLPTIWEVHIKIKLKKGKKLFKLYS